MTKTKAAQKAAFVLEVFYPKTSILLIEVFPRLLPRFPHPL
jgi:hypothetical protein